MEPWVIVSQFALGLVVLTYLGWPFVDYLFGHGERSVKTPEPDEPSNDTFVQVMSDLEYDFETGKLSEDDYKQLRRKIFMEADTETREFTPPAESDSESADSLEDAVRKARKDLDL